MGSYGITVNCATTIDDDGMTSVGLHVKDSSGLDIDRSAKGDSFDSVIKSLVNGVAKELTAESTKQRKATEKEKQEKISKLKAQIAECEKQLAAIEGKEAEKAPKKAPKRDDYAASIIEDILSTFSF